MTVKWLEVLGGRKEKMPYKCKWNYRRFLETNSGGFKKNKNRSHMIIINSYWTLSCLGPYIKYLTVIFSVASPCPVRQMLISPLWVKKTEANLPKEGSRVRDWIWVCLCRSVPLTVACRCSVFGLCGAGAFCADARGPVWQEDRVHYGLVT